MILAAGTADLSFLVDLLYLFALALVAAFFCDRLHVPTVVGFLLTGLLAGPYGFGIVSDLQTVEQLAEIGVILLLFSVGIEFSIKSLMRIKAAVLGGGSLQALITLGLTIGISMLFGLDLRQSIFVGFLVVLSSTAVVIKLMQQRGEMDSPAGRMALGILIFQDLIVVPMMLLIPLLGEIPEPGEGQGADGPGVLGLLLKATAVVAVSVVSARYLVPWFLFKIAGMRDRDVFLLSVICLVLAVAWLTGWAGLSLALGAFLAGLIISESEYSHRALGSILPFRDVFMSLFFISVGMLLNARLFLENPALMASLVVLVIVIKIIGGALAILFLGYSWKVAVPVGVALAQVGEFSFVLAKVGLEAGVIGQTFYNLFLAVSIVSIIATPFMMNATPLLVKALSRSPTAVAALQPTQEIGQEKLQDHLIIAGFGPTGRYVARAARAAEIPYIIIEMNPQTVRSERDNGEPIFYGDAEQEVVLEYARIKSARTLLIVIPDGASTRRVVQVAKSLNPSLYVIVRMRFISEMEPLLSLGADEVIPEELETAVEILARVLKRYLVPAERIESFIGGLRAKGYQALRSQDVPGQRLAPGDLCELEINRLRVQESSPLVGQTLAALDLRRRIGISVLAIRRGAETEVNPGAQFAIAEGDELFILGQPDELYRMAQEMSQEGGVEKRGFGIRG